MVVAVAMLVNQSTPRGGAGALAERVGAKTNREIERLMRGILSPPVEQNNGSVSIQLQRAIGASCHVLQERYNLIDRVG